MVCLKLTPLKVDYPWSPFGKRFAKSVGLRLANGSPKCPSIRFFFRLERTSLVVEQGVNGRNFTTSSYSLVSILFSCRRTFWQTICQSFSNKRRPHQVSCHITETECRHVQRLPPPGGARVRVAGRPTDQEGDPAQDGDGGDDTAGVASVGRRHGNC